jgi:hypothetical protein
MRARSLTEYSRGVISLSVRRSGIAI